MDSTIVLNSSASEGEWQYLATFGKQSLENDKMGLFVFFRGKDLIGNTEDKYSHIVVLKPEKNEITYYFGGIWEQDASGINSIEGFKRFLDRHQALLDAKIAH